MNLIFMLEEPSMKYFLEGFIARYLPEGVHVQYLVHEGKQDLEKSIPRKLKGWRAPNSHFVILRDKDAEQPLVLKQRLIDMCVQCDRPDSLVRIAVHHLESWILGDLEAVGNAYGKPNLKAMAANRKFRNPDLLSNASQELARIIPGYQKVSGARTISKHIDPDRNASTSFQTLLKGVQRLVDKNYI
ncbi:DUF4276 family protein [Pseudomonas sp. W5-36]|uniref:DUF4276 family protein n=1 Tax=Pseudomonas sp. W5-36 TaxID=3097455 RepID=UPI00397CADEF